MFRAFSLSAIAVLALVAVACDRDDGAVEGDGAAEGGGGIPEGALALVSGERRGRSPTI